MMKTQTLSLNIWHKLLLVVGGVILAFAFSLFFHSSSAWAVGEGGGGGGDIDAGGGSGGGPSSGIGTDTPDTPKPPSSNNSNTTTASGIYYDLGCTNWSGAGSWRMSASCNFTNDAVINGSPGNPKLNWGYQYTPRGMGYFGQGAYVAPGGCGPQGAKSAYGQTWRKDVVDAHSYTVDYKWYKSAGWVKFTTDLGITGQNVTYWPYGCLYPTTQWSSVQCFWNYNGNAAYSIDRTRAASAWDPFGTRSPQAGDPRPPSGGSGQVAPSCDRTGSAYVYYKTRVDKLGYYKVYIDYNYRTYTKESWIAWGNQEVYHNWTSGSTLKGSNTTWWTYSCRPGLANSTQGAYNSQGALPNIDAYTNPATCPQVNWQCKLGTATTAGLDRNAVAAGTVNPKTGVTVMRNGEQIPVTFSTLKVVDTSTPADIDVTNGGAAPGIKDVTKIDYVDKVKPGSTPFNGTDPNAANQYFKFFKAPGSTVTESFNTYYAKANENVNKAISFYWASDSASQPFAMQRQWKIGASFYVPQGGAIGGSSPSAPEGFSWKYGEYNCMEYIGRGATRVATGNLLTGETNPITVVRATNQ